MTEHDELYLLSGAYALNALEKEERARFEGVLEESEELRTEVTGLSDTAVLLGLSSRPVAPSPELKSNLMSLLATTPQFGPLDETSVEEVPAVPSATDRRTIDRLASGTDQRSHRAETKANAKWFSRPVGAIVAAAAAVALVAGGIAVGTALDRAPLEELAQASDSRLTQSDVTGGGTATLISSDELGRSAVLVDGLPALSADEVYQLWYIDDEGATSAGLLDSQSRLQLLDGDRAPDDAFGMTVEPRGGSAVPTTDPIVTIEAA